MGAKSGFRLAQHGWTGASREDLAQPQGTCPNRAPCRRSDAAALISLTLARAPRLLRARSGR
eukprot:1755794-Alexandrium_andersonii.AAC.1